jgi:hypothetical protein
VPSDERQELWRRAMEVMGKYDSGRTDIAERHDDYMAEGLYEEYLEKRG